MKIEEMQSFHTGATRSNGANRPDFSGYLSSWALELFGAYMLRHQVQADGQTRSANNWKRGMPVDRYLASLSRHYLALSKTWDLMTLYGENDDKRFAEFEEALGGIIFNVNGLAHEWMRAKEIVASSCGASEKAEFVDVPSRPSKDAPAAPARRGRRPKHGNRSTQSSPVRRARVGGRSKRRARR